MATKTWDDWQSGKKLNEAITHLFTEDLHTDVVFTFPNSPCVVKAHRLVLAMRSAVFERMFFGSLPENGENVEITDVEPETFKVFTRFLYTDDRKLITEDMVTGLMYVAEKYQVPSLKYLTECMYDHGLDVKSSLEKLDQAVRSGNAELADASLLEVAALGSELRDIPTHVNILQSTLEMLLDCEFIGMSELNLFRMCNDWAVRECGDWGYPATPEKKRHVMDKVFFKIRFPLMTPEELAKFVLPTRYLTVEEERLFLRHQCGVKSLQIPFITRPRSGLKVSYSNTGNTLIVDCFRPKWQILGLVVKNNVALNISCQADGCVIYGEYCCSFIKGKSYICIPEIKKKRIHLTIRAMGGSPVLDSSTCSRIAPDYCPEQIIPVDLGPNIPCTGLIYSLSKTYISGS